MQSLDLLNTVASHLELRPPPLPPSLVDGLVPGFTVFGVEFTAAWQQLLFGWWALAIIAAIVYVARGLLGIVRGRRGAQQKSSIHPIPSREEH